MLILYLFINFIVKVESVQNFLIHRQRVGWGGDVLRGTKVFLKFHNVIYYIMFEDRKDLLRLC